MRYLRKREIPVLLAAFGMAVVCIALSAYRETGYRNGVWHENTWRYRSSAARVEDQLMVSTYDILTGVTTTQTYSQEKIIRTAVADERKNHIAVYGENGTLLYERLTIRCQG